MKLYGYFRSSAAYRVRIALHLKEVEFESISVHLVKEGGQQYQEAYRALNPQARVPTLVDGSDVIHQSLAMLEYLEERFPHPSLLPQNPVERAHTRALASMIACDVHPLNNLSVLKYLKQELGHGDEQTAKWYQHWIQQGFTAFEAQLQHLGSHGNYCIGDSVSLADVCLIPQIYNAYRFECPMDPYPTLVSIYEHCLTLPAFDKARPENQPDSE